MGHRGILTGPLSHHLAVPSRKPPAQLKPFLPPLGAFVAVTEEQKGKTKGGKQTTVYSIPVPCLPSPGNLESSFQSNHLTPRHAGMGKIGSLGGWRSLLLHVHILKGRTHQLGLTPWPFHCLLCAHLMLRAGST